MLHELYSKLRKYTIIEEIGIIYHSIKDYRQNEQAKLRLEEIRKKKKDRNKAPRVGFIVQDPNIWNKNKPIFEAMKENGRIELFLICVPDPFDKDTSSTYRWYVEEGYDCIDARAGKGPWNVMENTGDWIDLASYRFDYVIYGQPYNDYLPGNLKSSCVAQFAKISVISYGITILKNFLYIRPRDFYRDVYVYYAMVQDEMDYNIRQFSRTHRAGLQRSKCFGPTVLEDFLKTKDIEENSWEFSHNKIRAIWTPRWTCDERIGGSNFFRYKDVLIEYAEANSEIDLLFRPHPMALDNFVSTGKMTVEEVEAFKAYCKASKNVSLDEQKEYGSTFWNSSFLITDISSVIMEYFATGKPIIFCRTEKCQQEYLDFFKKVLECCYIVDSGEELIQAIDKLKNCDDPLEPRRKQLFKELFPDISGCSKRIVEDLLSDFYES